MVIASESRLLLTKAAVIKRLGIGERAFAELGVVYVRLGKRRRYTMDDVMRAIEKCKCEEECHSGGERGRRTGGMTSASGAIGFEEALKQPV